MTAYLPYSLTPNPHLLTPAASNSNASRRSSTISSTSTKKTTALPSRITKPQEFITYILPDIKAVEYFRKDFVLSGEFHIIEETKVGGFDLYLVEQWVNDRKIGTIVSSFTGNLDSKIPVIRFTILKKQSKFYPIRFQEYLNELMLNHSKIKRMDDNGSSINIPDTSTLTSSISDFPVNEVSFVTDISLLPSHLNLIPLPSGFTQSMFDDFSINSNLKKLRCTGRSLSLMTSKISDANDDKFRHMYKIFNGNIPIKFAIREFINVIQICLFYYDLLDAKYCDGLLCNRTEEAIKNWWNVVGLPHFNTKPNFSKRGILPSATAAAILSLTLSVKLRLQLVGGCDVPKDLFDFENFMLSIGQFQRQYRLDKKRKLDPETLHRIFSVTTSKYNIEKNRNHYFEDDDDEEDGYEDNSLTTTISGTPINPNYSIAATPNSLSLMSPTPQHRKNKSHYGMELKKLTNVVKNTVQDRIIAAGGRDMDESGNIRTRKLAEISPSEVETLDLNELVNNYISGKTLIRLFHGYGSTTTNGLSTQSVATSHSHDSSSSGESGVIHRHPHSHSHAHSHHHHHHHKSHLADDPNNKKYEFISLRDKVMNLHSGDGGPPPSTASMTDISLYSRGLNRMRMGLQNTKGILLPYNKKDHFQTYNYLDTSKKNNGTIDSLNFNNGSNSIVDTLLQIPNDTASSFDMSSSIQTNGDLSKDNFCIEEKKSIHKDEKVEKCRRVLMRRSSFPLDDSDMRDIRKLQYIKKATEYDPVIVETCYNRQRSSSVSAIDNEPMDYNLASIYSFCYRYMGNLNNLIKYNSLQKSYWEDTLTNGFYSKESIDRGYNLLNLELIKLNNMQSQMNNSKTKIIDEDLVGHLRYSVKDLTSSIDRLTYETRIVVKRINELEENCSLFEIKLNEECKTKLTNMIENVIHSNRFKLAFPNIEERKDIIKKLGGDIELTDNNVSDLPLHQKLFRILIIFIFDLLTYISQIFHFDRGKMNLNRIRQQWVKLDPNRDIIKQAYNFIGREPSRDSVASIDTKRSGSSISSTDSIDPLIG
ncbi:uncharacterized protein RJT21DRAFT_54304 [Scheffersomyces amazonensis]|uniref:uncharacterized protein n=1 Tax=Scheffersomyces amazonensis TaxID=1078765 RepID=UPI00315CC6F1